MSSVLDSAVPPCFLSSRRKLRRIPVESKFPTKAVDWRISASVFLILIYFLLPPKLNKM